MTMKTNHPVSVAARRSNTQRNAAAIRQTRSSSEFGFRKFSTACAQKLNQFKERIAAELAKEFAGALNSRLVRQAVDEANSLAASTPFPALLLPVLAEEKVRKASAWQARQQRIHEQTIGLAV